MITNQILISSLLFLFLTTNALALPDVKVTIKVMDESGMPVENAKATVNFKAGTEGSSKSKKTDSDGQATLSGSSTRFIEYWASKEGYYPTWYEKSYTKFTGVKGFRKWKPWNETLVIELRKIVNPIELYIGNHQSKRLGKPINLPDENGKYGYDLIAQDWTVPHGIGTHSDFVFKFTGETTGRREYDYTLTLSFSNDGDGIQEYNAHPSYGSRLKLPHEAPEDGYQSTLVQRRARTFERLISNDYSDDRNYYFRIRTQKDKKGNVVSALYGKIYGNIMFSPGDKTSIDMLYYLNPNPNDRNLESDYKKNLFPSPLKYGHPEYPP